MEIAERLGDEALWAGAAEAYGWHKIIAGDLREGFDAQERAFDAADRGQRPFLAWMASNIRGQMTWGIGDPDAGAGASSSARGALPYAQNTAYRARDRRRHRPLPRLARRDRTRRAGCCPTRGRPGSRTRSSR